MNTLYDVQQLLKRFGVFVYTGKQSADIQLMDIEIDELYQTKLITNEEFTRSKMVLRKELNERKQ
ncbi:MAG TPA: YqgQ family protein [Bacillota bacterium]|nr:YqgQ family protein [Bacillota bacterium]